MDTMRRLFVVLGFLMVVGFLGVDVARESGTTDNGVLDSAKKFGVAVTSDAIQPPVQPTPGTPTPKTARPQNGGVIKKANAQVQSLNLNGCKKLDDLNFVPSFGKPIWKNLPVGTYAITAEGTREQLFGGSNPYWRKMNALGVMTDGTTWTPKPSDYTGAEKPPLPDEPYGELLILIGKDIVPINGTIPNSISNGFRFSIETKGTSLTPDINVYQDMATYYSNSKGQLTIVLYECKNTLH